MKWIAASERLPESAGRFCVKRNTYGKPYYYIANFATEPIYYTGEGGIQWDERDVSEWLDETEEQEVKEEAGSGLAASELRIGNWVLGQGLECPLTAFDIYRMDSGKLSSDSILLTPEILERCGFSKVTLENKWFNIEIGFIEEGFIGYIMPDSDGDNSLKYELTSLHQLQNLYFALTGIELEYSPY